MKVAESENAEEITSEQKARILDEKEGIKKTRTRDWKMHRDFELNSNVNQSGASTIDINLDNLNEAYSRFSPVNDPRLSPELYDYIEDEHVNPKRPVHINVYNTELKDSKDEQDYFSQTLFKTFTAKRLEAFKLRNLTLLQGLIFLFISLVVLVGLQYMELQNIAMGVLYAFFDVFAWVLGWGAVERLFLECPRNHRDYIQLVKLSRAKISFLPKVSDE